MPAGIVEGCWFLRSPQAHLRSASTFLRHSSTVTDLGMYAAGASATLALLATELALCGGSSLLLDFKQGAVGMGATRNAMALDAGATRILLVVDEDHGWLTGVEVRAEKRLDAADSADVSACWRIGG